MGLNFAEKWGEFPPPLPDPKKWGKRSISPQITNLGWGGGGKKALSCEGLASAQMERGSGRPLPVQILIGCASSRENISARTCGARMT